MTKHWRFDFKKLVDSEEGFKEAISDTWDSIAEMTLKDAVIEILFFWRVNLQEDIIEFEGEKDYTQAEIDNFQEQANDFLRQNSNGLKNEVFGVIQEEYILERVEYKENYFQLV